MIAVPSLHVVMTVDTSCIPLGRWGLACRGSASAQATLLYVLASERHNAWNPEVGTGAMSLKLGLQTAAGRANCCTVCIGSQWAVTTDKQTHRIRYCSRNKCLHEGVQSCCHYTAGVHLDSGHHCWCHLRKVDLAEENIHQVM